MNGNIPIAVVEVLVFNKLLHLLSWKQVSFTYNNIIPKGRYVDKVNGYHTGNANILLYTSICLVPKTFSGNPNCIDFRAGG